MAAAATDVVLLATAGYVVAAEQAIGDNSAALARTNALRQRLRNLSASRNIMIYSQINIRSQA